MKAALLHLSWNRNGDRFDVAVAANRLAARGAKVWLAGDAAAGLEAGDYIVEASPREAERLAAVGISFSPLSGSVPSGAVPLAPARIALLAGNASAYPYYAYYALALARLGLSYRLVDGAAVAGGALDAANLFILPGGFSNWGLDAEEECFGADAAARDFLARGGACIGSCGGAFYLSAGRPCWTGTALAKPRFTHEYLRTGVGIVSCTLTDGRIGMGLPPTLEIPYFHGPVYDELGPGIAVLGEFRDLYAAGRLFIDNPLGAERFERDMAGRPAMLYAEGPRGRAVLFSPHPEMGDLLRKYMALEDYVRHYLPIRGRHIMEQSLAFYRPLESPSFRLILNAVHALLPEGKAAAAAVADTAGRIAPAEARDGVQALVAAAKEKLRNLALPADDYGSLQSWLAVELGKRLDIAAERLPPLLERLPDTAAEGARILQSWTYLARDALHLWAGAGVERRPAERMLEADLALSLMEAWARLAEIELAVS